MGWILGKSGQNLTLSIKPVSLSLLYIANDLASQACFRELSEGFGVSLKSPPMTQQSLICLTIVKMLSSCVLLSVGRFDKWTMIMLIRVSSIWKAIPRAKSELKKVWRYLTRFSVRNVRVLDVLEYMFRCECIVEKVWMETLLSLIPIKSPIRSLLKMKENLLLLSVCAFQKDILQSVIKTIKPNKPGGVHVTLDWSPDSREEY